jgi:hypothetical protein
MISVMENKKYKIARAFSRGKALGRTKNIATIPVEKTESIVKEKRSAN